MKKSLIVVSILLVANCAAQLAITTPSGPVPQPTSSQLHTARLLTSPAKSTNYTGLTINRTVQQMSQTELSRIAAAYHATRGVAVAMDANSGAIMALATVSAPASIAVEPWEPGSVMKPLLLAAALNNGSIKPTTTYYEPGSAVVQHRVYTNVTSQHGITSIQTIITQSINTGAIFMLKSLGGGALNATARTVWYNYLTRSYRFTSRTNIGLPYEQAGFVRPPNGGLLLDQQYASSAFGVGVAITPIQLLMAYAAIGTNGTLREPHLTAPGNKGRQYYAVSPKTSSQVQQILETSYRANYGSNTMNGCTIGGKSGTAPIANTGDTYKPSVDDGTFVGYAHCGNQTVVLLVRLDQPQTEQYASHIALIPWQSIMNQLTAMLSK